MDQSEKRTLRRRLETNHDERKQQNRNRWVWEEIHWDTFFGNGPTFSFLFLLPIFRVLRDLSTWLAHHSVPNKNEKKNYARTGWYKKETMPINRFGTILESYSLGLKENEKIPVEYIGYVHSDGEKKTGFWVWSDYIPRCGVWWWATVCAPGFC